MSLSYYNFRWEIHSFHGFSWFPYLHFFSASVSLWCLANVLAIIDPIWSNWRTTWNPTVLPCQQSWCAGMKLVPAAMDLLLVAIWPMNQSMVDVTIPWVCLITSLVLPRFHLGLTCRWIWVIWIRLLLQPLRGRLPLRFHASQGWWLTLKLSKNLTQINLSHNHLTSQIISTHCEKLSFPSVQKLRFSGQLNEQLDIFDLSGNPKLSPFSNNFNVSLKLNVIRQLRNLLNHNGTNSLLSSFPQISRLEVTSTKLKTFPDFLRNEFKLSILDLSDIQTLGKRVNWIWKLNNLLCLEISYNYLVTLEGPLLHICSFWVS